MGTAASIVALLMVVGGVCSCILHNRKYRRTKDITRHEYQRAMDAKTVGEGIITKRNSTYNRLPLCQVLKFRCLKNSDERERTI
jgi:hypothetical protein